MLEVSEFAMKVLSKADMVKRNKVKRVQTEREILCTANHPFIVTLHWSFQSSNCLYFIMDYCAGGEFFRALQRQPGRCLPEAWAKFYACEVLLALEYLHMMGFIYRDLKPENILMTAQGHIVLTDFDLSKGSAVQLTPQVLDKRGNLHTEPGIVTNSFVGTEEYIAPEVIKGFGHTSAVDWWTFGVLLFEFLFGTTPFRGQCRDDTFGHILDGEIHFPERVAYPAISKPCKDIIKHLLNIDASKRLGATHGACEVKNHPWFKGTKWELIRNQTPPIVPQITSEYDTRYFPTIEDDGLIDRLEAEALAQQQATTARTPTPTVAKPTTAPASTATADPFRDFDAVGKSASTAVLPPLPTPPAAASSTPAAHTPVIAPSPDAAPATSASSTTSQSQQ